MTLTAYRDVEAEVEISDPEIIAYVTKDPKRHLHFLEQLNARLLKPGKTGDPVVVNVESPAEEIARMPSLARDLFLAELCREVRAVGGEWPTP